MDVSKFLGKVMGLYEIVISIAMLMNMHHFMDAIQGLINNDGIMLLSGCCALILGLLLVVSHNIWQWNWRVLITIVAWLVLIKGASLVLCPHFIDQLTERFIADVNFAYTIAVIDLIFGVVLCYFGFRRKA